MTTNLKDIWMIQFIGFDLKMKVNLPFKQKNNEVSSVKDNELKPEDNKSEKIFRIGYKEIRIIRGC